MASSGQVDTLIQALNQSGCRTEQSSPSCQLFFPVESWLQTFSKIDSEMLVSTGLRALALINLKNSNTHTSIVLLVYQHYIEDVILELFTNDIKIFHRILETIL